MKNYPFYNVSDCTTFKIFLETIYRKYSKKIAFKCRKKEWTYKIFVENILKFIKSFPTDFSDYFSLDIDNPFYFGIAFFGLTLKGKTVFLGKPKDFPESKKKIIPVTLDDVRNSIKTTINPISFEDIPNINPNTPLIVAQSSGTTSVSKGVMLSQKNLLKDTIAGMKVYEYKENSIFLNLLPLTHLFGLVADFLGILWSGSTICFSDNKLSFFKDLTWFKPTNLNLPPAVIYKLYDLLKTSETDITGGNLRKILSAGAAFDDTRNDFFRNFGFRVFCAYGLTECSPCVSMNRDEYFKSGSAGVILPSNQVRIKNGEIQVKGDNVMLGYFANKEETKKVLQNGWLSTGDLGFIDEDGFLFLTGRKSSLIVFNDGTNLFPENLENKINAIKGVRESLVKSSDNSQRIDIIVSVLDNNIDKINQEVTKILETDNLISRLNKLQYTLSELEKNELGKIKR